MSFLGLAFCLTLLAYGAAVLVGSPIVLPLLRLANRTSDPDARAGRLFALRLMPSALGIFVAFGLVLPAFVWLEPRSAEESLGRPLLLLASLSASLVAIGIVRCGLDLLATRRLVRGWSRGGRPIRLPDIPLPVFAIEETFPLVTVAGCARPRLFVSSTVLERCTSAELTAILAHESGHLRRGDPWKRLILRACPDVLALTPVGARIERRWAEAAEQAADDHASAMGSARSLDLASALLKVARLAGTARPHRLPLTALYRGDGVRGRVERLIEHSRAPGIPSRHRSRTIVTAAVAAGALFVPAAAYLGVLHQVHHLLETVVRHLG